MTTPNYIGRSAEQILTEESHVDSMGCFYRAMSWLDYFKRTGHFQALLYTCLEGRYGIESLLFEELVLATGAQLAREEYIKCLKEQNKLKKFIHRLGPNHEKHQQFTAAVLSLQPNAPTLIYWNPKEIEESWRKLSDYLHWVGATDETTSVPEWRREAFLHIERILKPIWNKAADGPVGYLAPYDMNPDIFRIWEAFRKEEIDLNTVKFRLKVLQPLQK